MALRSVRRWSWVPVAASLGLMQGCFTAGDDDSGKSSSGCSKDSDCREGRICENKVCVTDPNSGAVLGGGTTGSGTGGSSSGGTTSTPKGGTSNSSSGGSGATGGTSSPKGGSSGTTGGSGGTGGTGAAQGGTTSSTGGTGGTTGTCADTDPATCPTSDSMTFCSGGTLLTYTCTDYCGTLGFPVGPCSAPDGCACDFTMPTDQTCVTAMNAVCNCLDGTANPCIDTPDPNNPDSIIFYPPYIYSACHGGDPADQQFLHCIADQTTVMPAPTCQDAFNTCGAGEGGAAGTPAM